MGANTLLDSSELNPYNIVIYYSQHARRWLIMKTDPRAIEAGTYYKIKNQPFSNVAGPRVTLPISEVNMYDDGKYQNVALPTFGKSWMIPIQFPMRLMIR